MEVWICVWLFNIISCISSVYCEIDELTTVHSKCIDSVQKMCSDGTCVYKHDGCEMDGECGMGKKKCEDDTCLSKLDKCPEEREEEPDEVLYDMDMEDDRDLSSRTSLYYITIPLGVILVVSSIACRACNKTSGGQRRYHSWRQSFRESVNRRSRHGPANDVDYQGGGDLPPGSDPPGHYSSMEPCYPAPTLHNYHHPPHHHSSPSPTPGKTGYLQPSPVLSGGVLTSSPSPSAAGRVYRDRSPSPGCYPQHQQQHQQQQQHYIQRQQPQQINHNISPPSPVNHTNAAPVNHHVAPTHHYHQRVDNNGHHSYTVTLK